MIFYCFISFISLASSQLQSGNIFDNCVSFNSLIFPESPGGTLYFTDKDRDPLLSDIGFMNDTTIFNCSVVIKGRSQNSFPYKIFLGLHFRLWNFDPAAGERLKNKNPDTYFPLAKRIASICGETCPLGCMQITSPTSGIVDKYCGGSQLSGKDYARYFEENTVILKFYLIGGIYVRRGSILIIFFTRPIMSVIIDFYSFYFGKCISQTSEFQCIYTDRCININLKCDKFGGMDCGIPIGGSSITYDQSLAVCSQSTVLPMPINNQPNSIWLVILIVPFVVVALIWLFYRPGWCCWRCARLRNCHVCQRTCCNQCCTRTCTLGNAPNGCLCCMTSPNFQKFLNSPRSSDLCCLVCCNYDGGNSSLKQNGFLSRNKISPCDFENYHTDNLGWTKYALGDGYHLRECR